MFFNHETDFRKKNALKFFVQYMYRAFFEHQSGRRMMLSCFINEEVKYLSAYKLALVVSVKQLSRQVFDEY